MNKEEMLLEALNRYGNFTTVTQEFNENQLGVIYELMDMVKQHCAVNGVDASHHQALHKHIVNTRFSDDEDEEEDFDEEEPDFKVCMCCGSVQQSGMSCKKCAGPLRDGFL